MQAGMYITAVLVYLLLYLHKTAGFYMPIISDYVADLLCLPLVFGFCRIVMIRIKIVPASFELSISMIVFAFLAFSIIFECLLPQWSPLYKADPWDIAAYGAGAIIYYLLRRKSFNHDFQTSDA